MDDVTDNSPRHPLAFDRAGEPIEVSEAADAFRVVHFRRGEVTAVQDRDGGGALYVPLSATAAELAARSGPGAFKLVQVAVDRQAIKDAAAGYVEIAASKSEEGDDAETAPTESPLGLVLDALAKSHDVNRASLERVSTALTDMGHIVAESLATLAKLASGQPIQPVEIHAEAPAPPQRPDYVPQILGVAQQLLPLLPGLMQALKGSAAPTQAPAAPAEPTPTGTP